MFSVYHGKVTGSLVLKKTCAIHASFIFQKIHAVYDQIMSDIQ